MTEKAADALAIAIENYWLLQILHLRGNSLKSSGVIRIVQSLSMLSGLILLNICHNEITRAACDAIAIVIISITNLEDLYINENFIDVGAKQIANALQSILNLNS